MRVNISTQHTWRRPLLLVTLMISATLLSPGETNHTVPEIPNISINVTDVPTRDVLLLIAEKSNIPIVVNEEGVRESMSISLESVSVEQALKDISRNQTLYAKIEIDPSIIAFTPNNSYTYGMQTSHPGSCTIGNMYKFYIPKNAAPLKYIIDFDSNSVTARTSNDATSNNVKSFDAIVNNSRTKNKIIIFDLALIPIPKEQWLLKTPESLLEEKFGEDTIKPVTLDFPEKESETYIIQTQEEGVGLLQISRFNNGNLIRWKMLETPLDWDGTLTQWKENKESKGLSFLYDPTNGTVTCCPYRVKQ